MIPVTKPFMPPIEDYNKFICGIWDRGVLTNNGPLVQELEQKLKDYLGVKNILYVSNGTIALQIAIKALELAGDVITTPFSYVATTSSLVWEGCNPVFVDIDPNTLNIDHNLIEDAITPETTGILATHVFGIPCDIDAIQSIADKHGLKVIYDAAHCFGTKYKGRSVFEYGDISTTSFHATKLFHTIEGGAIFTNNPRLHRRMSLMRNFGHSGFDIFDLVGINGKNSEFHAAMGLVNLKYVDEIINRRKVQHQIYDKYLRGGNIRKQKIQDDSIWNFSYYPILLENETTTLKLKKKMEQVRVFPRRYFYPCLSNLNYVNRKNTMYNSLKTSECILCLPLYDDLGQNDQIIISEIVTKGI